LLARSSTHAVTLRSGPAEVVLEVDGDSHHPLAHGFAALVDALVGEPGRGAVTIGIEFVRGTTPAARDCSWAERDVLHDEPRTTR
jgi:hypothetical protein